MATLSTPIYNREGKAIGQQDLSPIVFGVTPKEAVLHEAMVAQMANARQPVAHTKTRGEVRGGGRKPWRQKGTGRARHGSSRSPIWVGGGITFGPRSDRNFSLKLNRRTKNLAVRMSLSSKVADGKLVVLDAFTMEQYKTKEVAALIHALPVKSNKILLVLPTREEKVTKSARNIPGLTTINAASLNVVDILGHGTVLTTAAGVDRMTAVLAPKSA